MQRQSGDNPGNPMFPANISQANQGCGHVLAVNYCQALGGDAQRVGYSHANPFVSNIQAKNAQVMLL